MKRVQNRPAKRPASRRLRLVLTGLALVAGPIACSSSQGALEKAIHTQTLEDGQVRLKLDQKEVETLFLAPRRYPFTVAVAPLYVEWSDRGRDEDGESTIHRDRLETPVAGDDPRMGPQTKVWPADREKHEEELAILKAAREGASIEDDASTAPAGSASRTPPGATGAARIGQKGDRAALRRFAAARGGASPPQDDQTPPPPRKPTRIDQDEPAPTTPDPVGPPAPANPDPAAPSPDAPAAGPDGAPAPAPDAPAPTPDAPAPTPGAPAPDAPAPAAADTATPASASATPTTAGKKKKELSAQEEEALEREVRGLDGKQFAISESGFQDRMAALLEQFGMFERVEKVKFVTEAQRHEPTELITQADARGADFLLVGRLRRNKVSYTGISSTGAFLGDLALWLLFWWPSELWPGVASEEYRSDVELVIEIYDVRSKQRLWGAPYRDMERLALSQPDRGWVPWGILLVRMGYLSDTMLGAAGERVRPYSWLEVEYQILRDLWSPEGFKGQLDKRDPTFEDTVNTDVTPRRQGLVASIARYGPQAADVLAKLARDGGADLAKLREVYKDDQLELGTRVYAETDGEQLAEFMVNEARFGRGDLQLLLGARATRTRLKAALRQVAKARRPDPVFVYLNGQVVVADDPSQPNDELKKYLLPYDADLVKLEGLLELTDEAARTKAILAHLDEQAISFNWIAETFNQASLEDHRYLMSRELVLVIDSAVPGDIVGLRYAPIHARNVAGGWTPRRSTAIAGGSDVAAPGSATIAAPDTATGTDANPQTPPGDAPRDPGPGERPPVEQPGSETPPPTSETPATEAPPPATEAAPPATEAPPPATEAPPPAAATEAAPPTTEPPPPAEQPKPRRPRRLGQLPAPRGQDPITLPAQQGGDQPLPGAPAAPEAVKEAQVSEDFLKLLARPGRKVILTGRFNDRLLDVVPKKSGAFVYHFLRGARDRGRVPFQRVGDDDVVLSQPLINYVRSRIEDESRTLNQPQSILSFGDNDDFPVVERSR